MAGSACSWLGGGHGRGGWTQDLQLSHLTQLSDTPALLPRLPSSRETSLAAKQRVTSVPHVHPPSPPTSSAGVRERLAPNPHPAP